MAKTTQKYFLLITCLTGLSGLAGAGEAVKLFVVKSDPALTEADLKSFCRENLTAYKIPRVIVFRDDLPKSNVGKILRRELKDEEAAMTA